MNSTQIASRLHFMAQQCRGEADRWNGETRRELLARARMLALSFPMAYSKDPDVQADAVARIDGAIDCLVDVMTARTERTLTKGTTP